MSKTRKALNRRIRELAKKADAGELAQLGEAFASVNPSPADGPDRSAMAMVSEVGPRDYGDAVSAGF